VARASAAGSRQSFASSTASIASTLQLAIEHEQDLIFAASAFVADDPDASNQRFREWATSVDALARYPELIGFGHTVIVTAAQLPAFAAQAVVDPDGPLGPHGTFQVLPPGRRSFYCLLLAGTARYKNTSIPAGDDTCAPGPARTESMSLRDTGGSTYTPLQFGTFTYLSVQSAVYRGGTVPTTVATRRAAFLGWVGMGVIPAVLLRRALQGHPDTGVILSYHGGSSNVAFESGKAPTHAESATVSLHNGWTVRTFDVVAPSRMPQDGDALALLIAGIALSLITGVLMFVLGTDRARAQGVISEQTDELRHQALHDALTGLPNRTLIMDRIEQLLSRGRRHGTEGALLYIDLDEFKAVNDTHGHVVGDKLLVAASGRLQNALRDVDTIGRIGGDEFVVLVDGASLAAAPDLIADRLLEVMREPFVLDGATMPLVVNTSIGIAVGDRPNPVDLLRDADVALYQAKAAGKNRYEIFNREMHTEIQQRIELEFGLRSALSAGQFRLVYLPIYNLDDLAAVGVEALLRWEHPTRGLLQPESFVPLLEQTGQIREVGRWVLREACEQMAKWQARGDTLDISVNVSASQLDDDGIVEHISDALASSGLAASSLIIEITEAALMRGADAVARRLEAVKALGVRIAVDDFGSGYASLDSLHRFPLDCLKIDRRFTEMLTTSPESRALIGILVQLGKDLNLKILAEGVETTSQMLYMCDTQVTQAQGRLLGGPLSPDVIEAQVLAPSRSDSGVY